MRSPIFILALTLIFALTLSTSSILTLALTPTPH